MVELSALSEIDAEARRRRDQGAVAGRRLRQILVGQAWIEVLDSFNLGARLTRGRSYARQGQVISIDVGDGTVTAKVQGSRPKPYDISISVNRLSDADWQKVVDRLNEQAVFAAKLFERRNAPRNRIGLR